ncbi:MAG: hypothetical protein ABIO55_08300 [Ginsengibacter sp.]
MSIKQTYTRLCMQLQYFAAATLISTIVIGCQVRLVPQYSAELENQIINGAKMTDKLYLEMIDAPADKKNYLLYSEKYLDVETEINSILFKNEAREKAADIIKSVKILRDKFVKYKRDHKTRNSLSNPELILYNEDLKAFWAPVLVEEKALSAVKQF